MKVIPGLPLDFVLCNRCSEFERPRRLLLLSFTAIMEHQLQLPILPSQCHSSSNYVAESSDGHATVRQPLQESAGNAQHGEMQRDLDRLLSNQARRAQIDVRRSSNHSPITPSILTPPIVPTQALGSTYGPPVFTRLQEPHESHLQLQQRRRRRADINPLCLYPGFQNDRRKQDEMDHKPDQKWPQVLEDAFLEGKRRGVARKMQQGKTLTGSSPPDHPSHREEQVRRQADPPRPQHAHHGVPGALLPRNPPARRRARRHH